MNFQIIKNRIILTPLPVIELHILNLVIDQRVWAGGGWRRGTRHKQAGI